MHLIDNELSEPYSIFTYRYFLQQWPNLCVAQGGRLGGERAPTPTQTRVGVEVGPPPSRSIRGYWWVQFPHDSTYRIFRTTPPTAFVGAYLILTFRCFLQQWPNL